MRNAAAALLMHWKKLNIVAASIFKLVNVEMDCSSYANRAIFP